MMTTMMRATGTRVEKLAIGTSKAGGCVTHVRTTLLLLVGLASACPPFGDLKSNSNCASVCWGRWRGGGVYLQTNPIVWPGESPSTENVEERKEQPRSNFAIGVVRT